MKKTALLAITLFSLLFVTSCNLKQVRGNGNIVTKSISTGEYDAIEVEGSLDVVLVDGTEGKIEIKGEDNIIDLLEVKVEDNVLVLTTESGVSYSTSEALVITVPVEKISAIALHGSGDVVSKTTLHADALAIDLDGSGDIELKVKTAKVSAEMNGSGDIELEGKTTSFDCDLSGSGDIRAKGLKAKNVDATLSGSGDITVNAKASLKAEVNGSGSIQYKGNPDKLNKKVAGSGGVSKL